MQKRGGSIKLGRQLNLAHTPKEPDLFLLKYTATLPLAVQCGIFKPYPQLILCHIEGSDINNPLRTHSPIGKGIIFEFHSGKEQKSPENTDKPVAFLLLFHH